MKMNLKIIYYIYTVDDKTLQINTRCDMRKTPINDTEESLKSPNILKMYTDKDPYPWLDDLDPTQHMTDKEILDSTIGLSRRRRKKYCRQRKEKRKFSWNL